MNRDSGPIPRFRRSEPASLAAELVQRGVERGAGELDQPAIGLVHFDDQIDRAGDRQRADEQRRDDAAIGGANRPKLARMTASQNTRMVRKGHWMLLPACSTTSQRASATLPVSVKAFAWSERRAS